MERGGASLWQATAEPAPACPPLAREVEADVAIVGGGYTGLSTALALAAGGASVVVLEALEPGSGASGRNGGQVIPGIRHFPDELEHAFGPALGRRLYEFGLGTADAAFALIQRHGIACDATRSGWLQPADKPTSIEASRRRVGQWQRMGHPVRLLERDEMAAALGSPAYLGGWVHEGGGTVQPLSYARGLARAAMAAGARIHGRSPALSLAPVRGRWRVATPAGSVTAGRVLLATNALGGDLWPALRRSLLPVWSFQVATTPLSPADRARVLPGRHAASDTREVLRYFRLDRDGRLVIGGKGRLGGPRGPGSFGLQRRMVRRLYPWLAEQPIAHCWGGQVAITPDRLPRVHELAPGLLAAIGCNGKGVALCSALGAPLAEALTGRPLGELPLALAPVRPIPFHALRPFYIAAGSAWMKAKDWLG
ncbi:glycine/D-amino acid oxidase-like deaminating enzyme [Stella humosa]|uniref:Glycine/D-amino acid oxidase-like deaminating enzyme n=1 Tax=Stella humosa TaxID=94 RepID=A0A3N1MJQ8_9PROT|nr:FAD-binding oxidoreductase [Stella humosa]ROQ01236.1 glycine/D-amino acid oxidase-like deaminating enzyme [Stella humosa]